MNEEIRLRERTGWGTPRIKTEMGLSTYIDSRRQTTLPHLFEEKGFDITKPIYWAQDLESGEITFTQ